MANLGSARSRYARSTSLASLIHGRSTLHTRKVPLGLFGERKPPMVELSKCANIKEDLEVDTADLAVIMRVGFINLACHLWQGATKYRMCICSAVLKTGHEV